MAYHSFCYKYKYNTLSCPQNETGGAKSNCHENEIRDKVFSANSFIPEMGTAKARQSVEVVDASPRPILLAHEQVSKLQLILARQSIELYKYARPVEAMAIYTC